MKTAVEVTMTMTISVVVDDDDLVKNNIHNTHDALGREALKRRRQQAAKRAFRDRFEVLPRFKVPGVKLTITPGNPVPVLEYKPCDDDAS